jgi:hypothetical protein
MPVSDCDVGAIALLCINWHGPIAGNFAAGRADELLDAEAIEGAKT